MKKSTFDWDDAKNIVNKRKHGVDFEDAQHAFDDPKRVIVEDMPHSDSELPYHCFG